MRVIVTSSRNGRQGPWPSKPPGRPGPADPRTPEGPRLSRLLRPWVGSPGCALHDVAVDSIAKPRSIMIVPDLPKTRSSKIMRRLLKDVAENRTPGDSTTLADSTVMDMIQSNLATAP